MNKTNQEIARELLNEYYNFPGEDDCSLDEMPVPMSILLDITQALDSKDADLLEAVFILEVLE